MLGYTLEDGQGFRVRHHGEELRAVVRRQKGRVRIVFLDPPASFVIARRNAPAPRLSVGPEPDRAA